MAQRNRVKIVVPDLQHISGYDGREQLNQDCVDSNWHFPKTIHRLRVAHFCEHKPLLFERHSYSRPLTIARLEHHRRKHGELGAWLPVLNEERHVLVG
jgi:hypothetical protein